MLVKGLLFSLGFLSMLSALFGYACVRAASAAERGYEELEA